ncbi:alpha/beta hydrolase [Actinophytocola algeriensis]|uniref:Pimeloyl-ACP methyl ester carboxylesterase n=1 Tax=Actinophytocola algeriensis TaxID=1768010 RepID=A0A7W7Q7H8_9PSEU|nr:alpha/beta hydrolase [Actinophytocola algeriensis]MBB4908268.1 pimeloyl-ACP methyl ester carboxylesterase [Actinophytocola algeriensis]MBE1480298.1 pimeloyl-ACP methyl ester carboxylesterase [Actinophytocola algeriensis]
MRKTLSTALVATAVAAVVLPGVSAATPASVRWGPCPEGVTAPGLECSTLEVPLDYRDPGGRRIEIAISRLAGKNPEKRRGVLLTNPGGPGGAGLDYPAVLAASGLPREVLDSYDLIGFDPRGVARSAPLTCELTQEQVARGNFPPYTHNAADVAKEAPRARDIAQRCADAPTASMLPHTTTANTARDMDRLRAALGEQRISYLGHSYGTYLGAVYTTMFPGHSDRFVLDSNLGPGGYDFTAMRLFARGLEDRFPDIAAYVAAHPEYGLGTTPAQVTATFFELAERLDTAPVHGIDGTAFRGLTFEYSYADATLPLIAKSWQALKANQKPPLLPFPADMQNLMAARFAVVCGDSRWPGEVWQYQLSAAIDRVRYPKLGGSTASVNPCAFWPRERPEPPVHIGDQGPSNVLIVQNERDPGTPLAGAKKLRQAFGDRARMVVADQGGHGVYPFGTNTCANNSVTTFLTTGERPAHDLTCDAEPTR